MYIKKLHNALEWISMIYVGITLFFFFVPFIIFFYSSSLYNVSSCINMDIYVLTIGAHFGDWDKWEKKKRGASQRNIYVHIYVYKYVWIYLFIYYKHVDEEKGERGYRRVYTRKQ